MKKLFLLVFILCFNNSTFAMFDKKLGDIFENAIKNMQSSDQVKSAIRSVIAAIPEYQNSKNLSLNSSKIDFNLLFDELYKIWKPSPTASKELQIKSLKNKQDFLKALENEFLKNNILKEKINYLEQCLKQTQIDLTDMQSSKYFETELPVTEVRSLKQNEIPIELKPTVPIIPTGEMPAEEGLAASTAAQFSLGFEPYNKFKERVTLVSEPKL